MTAKICPKCRGTMDTGFVLDRNYDQTGQSTWMEGNVEPNFWIGGVKTGKREQIPVSTYRCESCGYLESFATHTQR